MVGDTRVATIVLLGSIREQCSFDSAGSDKSYPGFYFAALEFHLFLDGEFKDWLVID